MRHAYRCGTLSLALQWILIAESSTHPHKHIESSERLPGRNEALIELRMSASAKVAGTIVSVTRSTSHVTSLLGILLQECKRRHRTSLSFEKSRNGAYGVSQRLNPRRSERRHVYRSLAREIRSKKSALCERRKCYNTSLGQHHNFCELVVGIVVAVCASALTCPPFLASPPRLSLSGVVCPIRMPPSAISLCPFSTLWFKSSGFCVTIGAYGIWPSLRRVGGIKTSNQRGTMKPARKVRSTTWPTPKPMMCRGLVWPERGVPELMKSG
jgi:hypothetical protein